MSALKDLDSAWEELTGLGCFDYVNVLYKDPLRVARVFRQAVRDMEAQASETHC